MKMFFSSCTGTTW